MIDKLDAVLVDGWRKSYKWASMQLAGVVSLLAILVSEYPSILLSTVQWWFSFPSEFRTVFGPVIGVMILVILALARLWQQKTHPGA